jgi:hypothetical protein
VGPRAGCLLNDQAGVAVTLSICMLEVWTSNLGGVTVMTEGFRALTQSLLANVRTVPWNVLRVPPTHSCDYRLNSFNFCDLRSRNSDVKYPTHGRDEK